MVRGASRMRNKAIRKKRSPPGAKKKPNQKMGKELPPQGDGHLASACANLRSLVESLTYDICMEIDARYGDLMPRKQKKYQSSRALIYSKIMKLQGFVKEVHKSGELIVEDMKERVTEDGLVIKEVF